MPKINLVIAAIGKFSVLNERGTLKKMVRLADVSCYLQQVLMLRSQDLLRKGST